MLEKALQENTEAIRDLIELLKSGAVKPASGKPAKDADDGDEDEPKKGKKGKDADDGDDDGDEDEPKKGKKGKDADDGDDDGDEITLESLRKIAKKVMADGKSSGVAKILKKFEAESLTELDEEHYAAVHKRLLALAEEE